MTNDIVVRLEARRAALGDGRDARSDNEKAAHWATARTIAQTISGLKNAPDDLARAEARLADAEARRTVTAEKQREIEKAIAEAPPWREHADGRERDRRYDHLATLRLQLQLLRDGTLLRAPGERYESLIYLDQRIKELTDRRDRAKRALEEHVRVAERLLAQTASVSATS